jgi:hypothetical protein
LRFFGQYCLGIKQASGPKARLGTIAHKILEILGECKKLTQEKDPKYAYFDQETQIQLEFDNIMDIDIDQLSQNVYQFYIKDIDPNSVPKSYQRKDPKKSVQAWLPFREIKKSVDNIMNMTPRSFDVRQMEVVATELKYDIEIKEPWATYDFTFKGKHHKGHLRLKGSIDLVISNNGRIEILDYKTGRSDNLNTGEPKTYEDYAEDIQLAMYSMVCSRYLGYDVECVTIVFLNEGIAYSIPFDDEMVMDRIKQIYEEMKSCAAPQKVDSLFCKRFCPFSKNGMEELTVSPKVKSRGYTWVNEVGIAEDRIYRACGQLALYFQSGYQPLEVMEALAQTNFRIDQYINT